MARGVYYVTWNFSVPYLELQPHYRCANIRENSVHWVWHYPWLQMAAGKSWRPLSPRETIAHTGVPVLGAPGD